jgi:hypothetical protein
VNGIIVVEASIVRGQYRRKEADIRSCQFPLLLPFLGFFFLFFLINYIIPQTWLPSPESFADHTGLGNMSEEELEAAYTRAGDFLRQKSRELVDEYRWSTQPADESVRHNALKL